MAALTELADRVVKELWETDVREASRLHRWGVWISRLFYVMGRELYEGQLNLRAMSLVYTTLLSLVPILALSFSVAKGLGLDKELEPLLYQFLQPLGAKGAAIGDQIMGFVHAADAKVLGGLGIALLAFTAVSLIQKIEDGLNFAWRVTHSHNLVRRFTGYLGVLITGPALVVVGLGAAASLMRTKLMKQAVDVGPIGLLLDTLARLAPYALVFAAFLVAYMLIPNTRVRWRSAAFGAAIGGGLWLSTGIAFAKLGQSSTQYDAIYSGFAIVLLFMIWMYLCWFILLFGAQVAFYHQNPRLMTRYSFRLQLGGRLREKLALTAMYLIGDHYYRQRPPWTLVSLSDRLHVTGDALETVVARLRDAGLLLAVEDEDAGFVPARDMATIHLREIVAAVRDPGQKEDHPEHYVRTVARVERLMAEVESAIGAQLGDRTLRDLVLEETPPA